MTKCNHTPGPWKAEDWGGIHTKIRAGDSDVFVATVTGGLVGQSGPNARLIANAPSLLVAVEELLATHPAAYREAGKIDNRTDNAIRLARTVLARIGAES